MRRLEAEIAAMAATDKVTFDDVVPALLVRSAIALVLFIVAASIVGHGGVLSLLAGGLLILSVVTFLSGVRRVTARLRS